MIKPGPLTFQKRPKVKITPRSYSFKMLTAEKTNSAKIAKDRLKIIFSHQHIKSNKKRNSICLTKIQNEILEVVKKYVYITQKDVKIELESNNNQSKLELNITLPDTIRNKV